MTIALSREAQAILDAAVASGRYASVEAVLEASLSLLAEQDRKLAELRDTARASLARGGSHTTAEVREHVRQRLADLKIGTQS